MTSQVLERADQDGHSSCDKVVFSTAATPRAAATPVAVKHEHKSHAAASIQLLLYCSCVRAISRCARTFVLALGLSPVFSAPDAAGEGRYREGRQA